MTQIHEQSEGKPWHREPWPWVIVGLLGTTIVASFITLWIAVVNPDLPVVDDAEYQRIKSELRAQPAEGEVVEDRASQADQDNG
ncbi:MAG TPA: FixH family protein [Xanthomonadales bacterium]|nr:FixH family protein [Xanthomonadales bacterium]